MAVKFKRKKWNTLYNAAAAMILICFIFFLLMNFFYHDAENKAYNSLRAEATYIKKDLSIRIKTDRRNLVNLANFAATLYADGRTYDIIFNSFKPIGLVTNIGILNPDNTFVTKVGSIDLSGKISFEEEVKKGAYISGRMTDLTIGEKEIVRCAAPIISDGKTVGILYGGISLDTISGKYKDYVSELNEYLFVYDKETGKFVVDTLNETPSELTMFMGKKYEGNHRYDDFISKESGFSIFKSAFRDENIYAYFSDIENINWGIILGSYKSDLFKEMYIMTGAMILSLSAMLFIIMWYFYVFIRSEKRKTAAIHAGSEIKKLLLGINQEPQNVLKSLQMIVEASKSRSAMFVEGSGEINDYTDESQSSDVITEDYRKQFKSELFRYVSELNSNNFADMRVIDIDTDEKLLKADKKLYDLFKDHGVEEVVFLAITYNGKRGILGVVNPKNQYSAKFLVDETAVCFAVAIYNKKWLNRTQIEANTDALTGVLNRVAYKKDYTELNIRNPENAACIFVDVNELHIRNNNYGHAAGDEMLAFIANALKNNFSYGKIYRIGGDEFLVLIQDAQREIIKNDIEALFAQLEKKDYHVAIGVSYRNSCVNVKEMIKDAENRMYDSKAYYYQNKRQSSVYSDNDMGYIQGDFEPNEIEHILFESRAYFSGVLRISLEEDTSHIIMAKAYPGRFKKTDNFSKRFMKYVDEAVYPDYHREVTSFSNYSALKKQLSDGNVPRISYKKLNGEMITLSVYNLSKNGSEIKDTLWIFARG